jgi:hypothetical protein
VQGLLDRLAYDTDEEVPSLVFGYREVSPAAQDVLRTSLLPVRAPSRDQRMTVVAVRTSGSFTMAAVRVPWSRGSQAPGMQPILVVDDAGTDKLVGYILPFNDVIPLIRAGDMERILRLSTWYLEGYADAPPGG